MWRSIFRHDLRIPLFTLALASMLGVALIAARTVLTWHGQHLFLVWNLFLAWIPLALALWFDERDRRGPVASERLRARDVLADFGDLRQRFVKVHGDPRG